MDQERARNQVESEKREARLKAEKEALSKTCEQEAADLGNAWAVVEAAAGFVPGEGGGQAQGQAAAAAAGMNIEDGQGNGSGSGSPSGGGDNKMHHLMAAAGAGGGGGGGGSGGGAGVEGENGLLPGIVGKE